MGANPPASRNLTVQIWDGDPAGGGTLLFEDFVGETTQAYDQGHDDPGYTYTAHYIENNGVGTVEVDWTPAEPGTYDIYVVVDPHEKLTEINEENNVVYRSIEVGGQGEDCNGNGIPDGDDLAVGGQYTYETGMLSPFKHTSPVDVSLPAPPLATGDVAVAAWASADLDSSNEYVDVFLNGDPAGQLFYGHGHQCTTGTKDRELLLIPQATFNAALPDGITITLAPTSAVDSCSGSVVVRVTYPAGSTDCNINGVPDECDVADGTSLDCNGNIVPDECESAGCRFATALSENTTGYDNLHFIGCAG